MITHITKGTTMEYRGSQNDVKPLNVTNGSVFIEIESGAKYLYDAENGLWVQWNETGISDEQIQDAVNNYLEEHPVSGEDLVAREGVSRLSESITDLQGTTKNLFDTKSLLVVSGSEYNNDVVRVKALDLKNHGDLYTDFEEGQYTVSFKARTNNEGSYSGNGIRVLFMFEDGTNANTAIPNTQNEFGEFVLTAGSTKKISTMRFTYNSGGSNYWEIKDFQLEKGNKKTGYVNRYTAKDEQARYETSTNKELIDEILNQVGDISNSVRDSLKCGNITVRDNSKYNSFNDLPINTVVNLAATARTLEDRPNGYNTVGHNTTNTGDYDATVITYGSTINPFAAVQICVYYNGDYIYSSQPRICIRYCAYYNTDSQKWSEWSIMSNDMSLHATDLVIDANSYQDMTFGDFNDAPPNTMYQVDMNCVEGVIQNHPSPGSSGVLMTFSFSPVTRHALVQKYYGKCPQGLEEYLRYGYKNTDTEFLWTPWRKVKYEDETF